MVLLSFFNFSLNLFIIFLCINKKIIPLSIMMGISLFLVAGQAIQIAYDLEATNEIFYLTHIVDVNSFYYAQLYYASFLISILFGVLIVRRRWLSNSSRGVTFLYLGEHSRKEFILLLFLILCSFVLVFFVVGLQTFLSSSRPGYISGSTIFLVLISTGLYPLGRYLFCGCRPSKLSISCFIVTFCITTAFSRIHSIIYILFIFYSWLFNDIKKAQDSFLLIKKFLPIFALILLIFFGVGSIRDAMNYTHGSFSDIVSYVLDNPESSLLSIRKNYIVGVEGMSGLAASIRYYLLYDPYPDFGLSSLIRGFFQWMPSSIKATYEFVTDPVSDFYFYKDSIVSPGIQDSFVSFLWFGGIIFASLCMTIFYVIPRFIYKSKNVLFCGALIIFLALGVFFVRGSWVVWIGYSFSYLLIYFAFGLVFFEKNNVMRRI